MKKDRFKRIYGERLYLEPLGEEHLEEISIIESDRDIWKYEENIESDREKLKESFIKRMSNEEVFDYMVIRKEDNEILGVVYVWTYLTSRKSWEIGYALKEGFRGKGYCLEAAELLNEFIFNELGAHKVLGMCSGENEKSAILMERLGMTRRGVFKEEYLCDGRWVDQYFYSILDHEFKERSKKGKNIR